MQPQKSNDKRQGSRFSVDILVNKYLKGRPYLCRATNLSRGGMLVHRLVEPANDETYVGLQFQLPGDERVITCGGQIVFEHGWIKASGIRFTSLAPEHYQRIDRFLSSQGA
jgi:hypothetical protein